MASDTKDEDYSMQEDYSVPKTKEVEEIEMRPPTRIEILEGQDYSSFSNENLLYLCQYNATLD